MKYRFVHALLFALLVAPAVAAANKPLTVVASVDLARYAGRWFEVARLPNRFQVKCAGDVTADYSLRPDGRIDVTNRCRKSDGTRMEASGIARRASADKPSSMLKVRFAPAFLSFIPAVWGDYQVIALDDEYRYALVGSQDRKYLWILSRTPSLDGEAYKRLVTIAQAQGFDVNSVRETVNQAPNP